MAGNTIGGRKAAKTNIKKYGRGFYRRIGSIGGSISTKGGFYVNRELARTAGSKGGKISKRGPAKEIAC